MKFSKVLFFSSLLIVCVFCLQGCFGIFSKEDRRIKSPCVRVDGNTECERRPVNDWWLQKAQ